MRGDSRDEVELSPVGLTTATLPHQGDSQQDDKMHPEADIDVQKTMSRLDDSENLKKPVDSAEIRHVEPCAYTVNFDGEMHEIEVAPASAEVRALIPETDDTEEPVETFRSYFLGTIVAVVGTGLNVWFGARQPGIYLSPLVAQFVVHPVGMAMARFLPKHQFKLFGYPVSLNPGPWSIKEHTIVTLMATVSLPTATALDIIIVTKLPVFFNDPAQVTLGYQFLIVLSTQFLGFGMAGISREFLVYPSAMTWPTNLAKCALFNALHRRKLDENGVTQVEEEHGRHQQDPPVHGWKISMFRFCLYWAAASFAYLFLTNYLMPFLTNFNWPTWIAPRNKSLAIIMGSITGFGINPFPTLDWTFVNASGHQPLVTPWWATFSAFIGTAIGGIIAIAMYFSNTWYSAHFLANSNTPFDRFGKAYNTTRVLSPEKRIDVAAYRAYSPLYYTAGKNIVFASYYASYSSTLVHALLNYFPQLKLGMSLFVRQFKSMFKRNKGALGAVKRERHDLDVHYVLMKNYKEVPQSWFFMIAVLSFILGAVCVEVYKTEMPIWGVVLAFFMAAIFVVPAGIVQAVSNVSISIVVLSQIIPGVLLPGRPYANMIFKLYGWVSLSQALLYVQDQKLAHYLHVPPRATFRAQMWGCLVGSLISMAVLNWQMSTIPDLCVPGQKDLMTCPYYTTFYSGALLYGVVGPTRQFGKGGLYGNLMWAFFIGAALTVVAWAVKKKWPNKITNIVNVPVIISGAAWFAPYNFAYVWSGIPLAWFFMSYIYKRFPAWWRKYCYILSIALTVGAALSGVFQFFTLTFTGTRMPVWWGNTFPRGGCDGKGCPLLPMPAQGYVGPGPGEFS